MQGLITACGKYCPEATLNIISNPVNSTVPIAAETLKGMGVYNPKKVMGVTTLDVVRAKTFYSEKAGMNVKVRNSRISAQLHAFQSLCMSFLLLQKSGELRSGNVFEHASLAAQLHPLC